MAMNASIETKYIIDVRSLTKSSSLFQFMHKLPFFGEEKINVGFWPINVDLIV